MQRVTTAQPEITIDRSDTFLPRGSVVVGALAGIGYGVTLWLLLAMLLVMPLTKAK